MEKDDIFSILAVALALLGSIASAKNKKKKALEAQRAKALRHRPEQAVRFSGEGEVHKPAPRTEQLPEEAPAAFKYDAAVEEEDLTRVHVAAAPVKHKRPEGFDARKAVLFSEILKPKFDQ